MGRVAGWLLGLLCLLAVAAAAALGLAHRAIRRIEPPLPGVAEVAAVAEPGADGPIRVWAIDTARQAMPRSAVLEPARDPEPDRPYVMGFPAFALEWPDGDIFLIDLGMDRESALAFGRPNEWVVGAAPLEFEVDVATALGENVARVEGVGFTHLHSDHTDGAVALCRSAGRALHVFYTPLQSVETNYTTRPGRAPIEEAGCLEPRLLAGGPLHGVPGFPGLFVFAAGGHTPGSQVFVARLQGAAAGRTLVFVGDLVNHRDGIRLDIPKPAWYSRWVVPEHTERLARLRRYLAAVAQRPGVTLLVSHDRGELDFANVAGAP